MPDAQIVTKVDAITTALMVASTHAVRHGDTPWMQRHQWFGDACERLFRDEPATTLDT